MRPTENSHVATEPGGYGENETTQVAGSDLDAVREVASARHQIMREVEKRIVGQTAVIERLLIALFARGHCLFVGVS